MAYPTLEQYNQSLQNPQFAFTDPELQKGSVKTTGLGLPLASCGGFALTYEITCSGKKYAVRCFHKESKDLEKRYAAISRKIKELNSDYFVNEFSFQSDGFKLQNKPVAPIVKMAWAKGDVLGQFLEDNYDNPTALANLRKSLENLANFLEKHHIAHGDIQPGNLMVADDGKKVQLIDYDGMFVEELKDAGSSEMGHKNFQHPQRNNQWDYTLDRFSFILIDLSLSILEKYPDLWDKTSSDIDAFLFRANDIYNPDGSQLFKDLKNFADCKDKVEKFSNLCKGDFEKIPSLNEFLYGKPKTKKIVVKKVKKTETISYISPFKVLDATDYDLCLENVGNKVELIGQVIDVKEGTTKFGKDKGRPFVFINFIKWRKFGKLVSLTIWSEGLDKFSIQPDESFVGKWLSVSGLIEPPYKSRLHKTESLTITINSPSLIHEISEDEAQYRLGKITKTITKEIEEIVETVEEEQENNTTSDNMSILGEMQKTIEDERKDKIKEEQKEKEDKQKPQELEVERGVEKEHKDEKLVVFDTETTGIAKYDRIVSFGAIVILNRQITNQKIELFFNPERKLNPVAAQITGLSDNFLKNKPKFKELLPQIEKFLEGADALIAHNSPFDLRFMNRELSKAGANYNLEHKFTIIDSLALAKKKLKIKSHTLDELCDYYQIDKSIRKKGHGALIDAELLAQVYLNLTANADKEREEADYYLNMAKSYIHLKDFSSAENCITKVLQKGDNAQKQEARELLAEIEKIKKLKQEVDKYLSMAMSYISQKDFSSAENCITEVLQKGDNAQKQKAKELLAEIEKIKKVDDYLKKADFHISQKEFPIAEDYIKKVQQEGDDAQKRKANELLAEIEKIKVDDYLRKAKSYIARENFLRAEHYIEKVLQKGDDAQKRKANELLVEIDKIKKAEQEKLEKEIIDNYLKIAMSYISRKDFSSAENYIREVLEKGDNEQKQKANELLAEIEKIKKAEQERLAREKAEKERLEKERQEQERKNKEKAEAKARAEAEQKLANTNKASNQDIFAVIKVNYEKDRSQKPQLIELSNDVRSVDNLLDLADEELHSGNFDKARNILNEVIRKGDENQKEKAKSLFNKLEQEQRKTEQNQEVNSELENKKKEQADIQRNKDFDQQVEQALAIQNEKLKRKPYQDALDEILYFIENARLKNGKKIFENFDKKLIQQIEDNFIKAFNYGGEIEVKNYKRKVLDWLQNKVDVARKKEEEEQKKLAEEIKATERKIQGINEKQAQKIEETQRKIEIERQRMIVEAQIAKDKEEQRRKEEERRLKQEEEKNNSGCLVIMVIVAILYFFFFR